MPQRDLVILAVVTFSNHGTRVAEFISSFFDSKFYYFGNDDFKNNDGKFFIKKIPRIR